MGIIEAMTGFIAKNNSGAVNELPSSVDLADNASNKLKVHSKLVSLMRDYNKPKYLDESVLYLKSCCTNCLYSRNEYCGKLNSKLNTETGANNKGHYINNDIIWNDKCIHYKRSDN